MHIFEKLDCNKEMIIMEQTDKALEHTLTVKRKRIMTYFIEATEKLIRSEGLEGLSIRKIASQAGYNSATIYNYFSDLEELTLFGSVCYLREYVAMLEKELRPDMRAIDQYRTIYRCFNHYAFRSPDIYHNMFFGKYSYKLGAVLQLYYGELFPEELEHFSDRMRNMLVLGNITERDRLTVDKMVQEGDLDASKADVTLSLIIAASQHSIYEASLGGEGFDPEAHKQKFNQLFEYLLDAAR